MKWFRRRPRIPKLTIPRGVRYTIDVDMHEAGDEVHRLVMTGHKRRTAIDELAKHLVGGLVRKIGEDLHVEMKRRAKKGRL